MRLMLTLLLLAPVAHAASPAPVAGPGGMVVSSQRLASEAGAQILREGGNAVDAAVATAYAEAVVNPCCGNLGGGGFLVARLADGHAVFLDFRETAPAKATRDMYLGAEGKPIPGASLAGWRAVAVPGSALGLDRARQLWGRLSRAQVMAPAIALARDGFVLTRGDTAILHAGTAVLHRDPEIARIFLRPDGSPLQPGDHLVQPDLARTLESLAQQGPDAFYKGRIADAIGTASQEDGGVLTAADLAAYHVAEDAPIQCAYRGLTILSAPPPSSGGVTLCETLGILEGYDLHSLGWHSAAGVHLIVEALRHAYLDRNTYLGDPAFVNNPVKHLLDPAYAAAIRAAIPPDRATLSAQLPPGTPPHEPPQTTHISAVDKDGGTAALTYTLNGLFGAGVMAPGAGVLLNDEMDDFTTKLDTPNMFGLVQGEQNAIEPGKRPLSSMAPTIVLRDGKPYLVLGSPGGARIITNVLQVLLNVADYSMGIADAVDTPRFHHQWLPDVVYEEPFALSPDTERILRDMGYTIVEQAPWGAADSIEIAPAAAAGRPASSGGDGEHGMALVPGWRYGAHDVRRPAGAAVAE
ncbi:MAG: gamma-glutamyltransferase [Acetobacteraceae bacterium]|nr:gamma-glutamyltransferase [Acetobacteraceae bacterium]